LNGKHTNKDMIMRKSIRTILLAGSLGMLGACTTTEVDTTVGGAAGAGVGYVVSGGSAVGAVVGGGLGALVGSQVGGYPYYNYGYYRPYHYRHYYYDRFGYRHYYY
jgi:hypothetical protein